MSDAEALAVVSAIASIIAIIDGTKKVYDAASNLQGLPEAFRWVTSRLPLVQDVLRSARQDLESKDTAESSYKGVKDVVEACEEKAQKLEKLFEKVIPAEDASQMKIYLGAFRTIGKGSKVETLMKGMLEDVQLLDIRYSMIPKDDGKREKVAEAIVEAETVPPLPEYATEEIGFTAIHSGSGAINQSHGDQFNNPGSGHIYHAASMNFGSYGDQKEACLTALSKAMQTHPRDDRLGLVGTKGTRAKGTCIWITANGLYKAWLQSRSQLLWLSGGPGKGKTMLSIFLAEKFQRNSQSLTPLEYFCDNKDERRNTAHAIILGLVFQLLERQPLLFDHILPVYNIQKESLFKSPSFESMWRIFEAMIRDSHLGNTYCIIDGLDECDEVSMENLLRKFQTLFSTIRNSGTCRFKLIMVSREFPEFIPEILSSFPRLRLDSGVGREVYQDIDRFIQSEVKSLATDKNYPKDLRLYIERVLRDRAQGTFLWVGIVVKTLKKCKATEVKEALDLFPPGLEVLYTRMLLQIGDNQREFTAKLLFWIVMAVRPLNLSELSVAVQTNTVPSASLNTDDIVKDQLSYCGDLITIADREVIHQSVKDYFLRRTQNSDPNLEVVRIQEELGHSMIVRRCIGYLQDTALAYKTLPTIHETSHLQNFPFLSYAALYWPHHARSLASSDSVFDLSLPFYKKGSRGPPFWLATYKSLRQYADIPDPSILLHWGSWAGILPLVERLLLWNGQYNRVKRQFYLDARDSTGRSALAWAARSGHLSVVRFFIKLGPKISAKLFENYPPLHEAIEGRHKSVVQLLLKEGANIDVQNHKAEAALTVAVRRLNMEFVELLLKNGANTDGDISSKDTTLVEKLRYIARYAEEKEPEYRPIHYAVLANNMDMVRVLLEGGANINKEGDIYGDTPLLIAVRQANEALIRLLLEKGANVEARDRCEKTALHVAAGTRHINVVKILLEFGADINVRDKDRYTILHTATLEGKEKMIRLIVGRGVDIEARNGNRQTALLVAAKKGNADAARVLLELGADFNVKDLFHSTVLHSAVYGENMEIVRLALEKGVDIKALDFSGNTALHNAAKWSCRDMVTILLELGVDINIRNSEGKTALQMVADIGYKDLVQYLTSLGAKR